MYPQTAAPHEQAAVTILLSAQDLNSQKLQDTIVMQSFKDKKVDPCFLPFRLASFYSIHWLSLSDSFKYDFKDLEKYCFLEYSKNYIQNVAFRKLNMD